MAIEIWGWAAWVITGLILLVALSGSGSMTGKKIGEILKSLNKTDKPLPTEIKEKLSAPILIISFKIKILLVTGIIFMMTLKTDWIESIATVVITFLVGLLIGLPSKKSIKDRKST